MRTLILLTTVTALSLCGPTLAQKSKGTPTTCETVASSMPALSLLDTSTVEAIENGCRVTNLVFNLGNGYSRFEMAEVTLVAPELFARWAEERLPDALELTVRGMQFSPQTGNPTTDYIIGVQQSPYDLHLQYHWDEATAALLLVDASMSSGNLGSISVSGTLADVSAMPTIIGGMKDIVGYGVAQLSVSLANRAILETFAIPTLVAMLPGDTDPRAHIETLRATLRAMVEALPDDIADTASRAALVDFIDAFPHPRQVYELTVTGDPPIPVAELAGVNSIPTGAALLGRLKIVAAHLWPLPPSP